MTDRVAVGQQRPTRMRRIGDRHMIVLPAQTAKIMSVDDVEQTLRVARQQEQQTQAQLDRHRAFIVDLEQQLVRFRTLPIERDADDPEVPQPAPLRSVEGRPLRVAAAGERPAVEPPPVLSDS